MPPRFKLSRETQPFHHLIGERASSQSERACRGGPEWELPKKGHKFQFRRNLEDRNLLVSGVWFEAHIVPGGAAEAVGEGSRCMSNSWPATGTPTRPPHHSRTTPTTPVHAIHHQRVPNSSGPDQHLPASTPRQPTSCTDKKTLQPYPVHPEQPAHTTPLCHPIKAAKNACADQSTYYPGHPFKLRHLVFTGGS